MIELVSSVIFQARFLLDMDTDDPPSSSKSKKPRANRAHVHDEFVEIEVVCAEKKRKSRKVSANIARQTQDSEYWQGGILPTFVTI